MGLLSRISEVLKANINELIARAEDPEKMLNAAIEEMQKQTIEAKSRVAMSIADEKRLEKQYLQQRSKAEDWEKKAMSAVRANRDDLAMEAIGKKKEHQAAAQQFSEQLDHQRAAVAELKRALSALTRKLEETRRRRAILLARVKRAEAQRQLAETLNAAKENSAAERLERLEARVERAEAEAEATWEVAAFVEGADGDLAREIAALEAGEPEDDLLALKARMKQQELIEAPAAVKALGSGDTGPTEVEETSHIKVLGSGRDNEDQESDHDDPASAAASPPQTDAAPGEEVSNQADEVELPPDEESGVEQEHRPVGAPSSRPSAADRSDDLAADRNG